MDECALRRLVRVDCDLMAGMGGVGRRRLEPLAARRALDEQSFAVSELMETLEEVDPAKWNALLDSTMVASEKDFLEPT